MTLISSALLIKFFGSRLINDFFFNDIPPAWNFFFVQRITSAAIMYIGQCSEFQGHAVHKLAAAVDEDLVGAPSGLIKVAVW